MIINTSLKDIGLLLLESFMYFIGSLKSSLLVVSPSLVGHIKGGNDIIGTSGVFFILRHKG